MVENISLTKYQVETLESIADLLESIDYSKEGAEIKFLTLIVNIESLLPKSNIFDYVFKTDITKDKKLELQEIKKQKFEVINSNVELLKSLPNDIEFKWNQVKENYNIIKENEEKLNKKIYELITVNNILSHKVTRRRTCLPLYLVKLLFICINNKILAE